MLTDSCLDLEGPGERPAKKIRPPEPPEYRRRLIAGAVCAFTAPMALFAAIYLIGLGSSIGHRGTAPGVLLEVSGAVLMLGLITAYWSLVHKTGQIEELDRRRRRLCLVIMYAAELIWPVILSGLFPSGSGSDEDHAGHPDGYLVMLLYNAAILAPLVIHFGSKLLGLILIRPIRSLIRRIRA